MNKLLNKFDWKYLLMLAIGITSLYPLFQLFTQSPERELRLQLISQSALQPVATKDQNLGLEITIDKVAVINPFITVFRIENTGREPILSKDFERGLEISIDKGKSIIRAQISDKTPNDLKPIIHKDNKLIRLDPILLNPHDYITVSILSSNGPPTFTPSARIAGIQSININTKENENKTPYIIPIFIILTIYLISISNALVWSSEKSDGQIVSINRRTAVLANMTLYYAGGLTIVAILQALDYFSIWNLIITFIATSILTFPISMFLEKRSEPNKNTMIEDLNVK